MSLCRHSVALQLGGPHLQDASRASESYMSAFRNSFERCHWPGQAQSRIAGFGRKPNGGICWQHNKSGPSFRYALGSVLTVSRPAGR
jgi:hypothetical protein